MHCFSHVLHLSIILSSIASYFITFMHLYGFLVPPWSSLVIFLFLGWSFIASCTIFQSWQKGEKMWVLFKILHVRRRNTCLCKGELCFILLGEVFTSFVVLGASFRFLYTGLVTIFTYIVLISNIYICVCVCDDVCLFHLPLHVLFLFSLYTHVCICTQSLFLFHTWCLDEFCLSVSGR